MLLGGANVGHWIPRCRVVPLCWRTLMKVQDEEMEERKKEKVSVSSEVRP